MFVTGIQGCDSDAAACWLGVLVLVSNSDGWFCWNSKNPPENKKGTRVKQYYSEIYWENICVGFNSDNAKQKHFDEQVHFAIGLQ